MITVCEVRAGRSSGSSAAATAAVLSLLTLGLPAQAFPRAPVLESLNAQRAAHGIPASITEVPDWSAACNEHWNYMDLNNYFGHDEVPDNPGYTETGAWAGHTSVLTSGGWPDVSTNPFEFAPIHLQQLLAPALSETGFSDNGGCVVTWEGYSRPLPDKQTRFYSYPGDGTVGWRYQESTRESPFTPAEILGMSNPTGPHIYIYPRGDSDFFTTAKSATVTDPSGTVIESRFVSRGDQSKASNYLAPGAIVIPVKPLQPSTTYTVTSEWKTDFNGLPLADPSRDGRQFADSRRFTTAAAPVAPPKKPEEPEVGGLPAPRWNFSLRGRKVVLRLSAHAGYDGQPSKASITFRHKGKLKRLVRRIRISPGFELAIRSPWRSGLIRLYVSGQAIDPETKKVRGFTLNHSFQAKRK